MFKFTAKIFFGFFLMMMFISLETSAQKFIKIDDGIIVYPNQNISGNVQAVRLSVMNDKIIKVSASATNAFHDSSLNHTKSISAKNKFHCKRFERFCSIKNKCFNCLQSINKPVLYVFLI